jgi:hypothetical protein
MIKQAMIGCAALALVFTSCNNDDEATTPQNGNLELNLSGLEDLGADYLYEGWVIVNGTPVSTGTFSVDGNGSLSATSFEVAQETLDSATTFVLTLEPNPDPDPLPSDQKLVAGDFTANVATISTATAPGVGDFSSSTGTFFLRTPTDEDTGVNNGNDQYGVWFGTPGAPPTPNLNLPILPTGWKYEGWVVTDQGPISTGTFVDPTAQLVDEGTPFSGPNPGPPVPGEDFFENAPTGIAFPLDVRGRTVVISVEPFPDNSPAPFLLKPLVGVAGQETAPSTHDFGFNAASLPTGTVSK